MVSTAQTDSVFAITLGPYQYFEKFGVRLSILLKGAVKTRSKKPCYLPMRIRMPAASARIPIMMVGMVMWNSRVIPTRIR